MPGWEEATAVQKVSTNTYSCILHDDWSIGSVPNGGYVTGCVLEVVKTHFSTSLAKQDQPHTIALHIEFLRRTQAGPALFTVEDVKLGRQASIVHVTMEQDGRQEIVAYVTNSNISAEEGFTFDTQHELQHAPPPVDLAKLETDSDEFWRWTEVPFAKFRKATAQVKFFLPRAGSARPNIVDEWICFSNGTNFTQTSIGFVSDMFPQIVENFKDTKKAFWYPTLLLNLDIKKSLPAEGVKWLRVRAELKQVKNGRMDLGIWIHDADANMPKDVKQKSGIIAGINAGHKVTPRTPAARISRRKGFLSKRTAFVREITREVAGLAPYEKRVIELLRNSKDKRARRLAKKRLGTFGRAKRKVDEMTKVIAESRRAGH
ncbi:hypothetical protein E8E12_010311 [Didymella heteroderae]|uniref:60S ribosomal protein L36 n=1 Tax=Didymella heteroderae TaxID=1769908 RepID=A0A9P4WXG8_9PLEO|nr:hypothetical protein E8E12_010311 [Didymella heteroderae]